MYMYVCVYVNSHTYIQYEVVFFYRFMKDSWLANEVAHYKDIVCNANNTKASSRKHFFLMENSAVH